MYYGLHHHQATIWENIFVTFSKHHKSKYNIFARVFRCLLQCTPCAEGSFFLKEQCPAQQDLRGGTMGSPGVWHRPSDDAMPFWNALVVIRDDAGGSEVGFPKWEKRVFFWVVVSNIFYFHPYLGKIPILTNIFQMGWNHQLGFFACLSSLGFQTPCFWSHLDPKNIPKTNTVKTSGGMTGTLDLNFFVEKMPSNLHLGENSVYSPGPIHWTHFEPIGLPDYWGWMSLKIRGFWGDPRTLWPRWG